VYLRIARTPGIASLFLGINYRAPRVYNRESQFIRFNVKGGRS
jgi:hypothetical protein